MTLRERHTGNVLAVKLTDQENLHDDQDAPNMYVNYIALGGRLSRCPMKPC